MNVLFEERPSLHGFRIGIATLDAEKSLNALSLPMIEALAAKLDAWAEDAGIACVLLRGNGAKAFCAGGDVRKLVDACREQPGEVPALARRFFADEYRLDYRIHTYPKPFICWAHGYVMGGGMGLMQGAGIRIVTPSSRLAMPEIGIGLYPDVGASWFLARLPGRLGLFLGLSAAQMNWNESPQVQLHSLLRALEHEARGELPEAQLLPRRPRLDALLDQPDLASAWQALVALRDDADPLLARGAKTLAEGCPMTAHLVWQQIERARYLSLAEVFRLEYAMSLNCTRHPDFAEGVRARLIDRDNAPNWHWPQVESIPQAVIEAHFEPTWEGEHPLAGL
ncbi:enoyl-CoA hydratase/isomerase family protein [Pseudomonas aeruginosa]|uniref:enoyl-CoA hydratase/isomerase family protein n=1 Tax=Pseudomonas aeruginosa TaxID=287 RepID=UPI000BB569ED|nr:enoyl-CoA hydratase/isomerase family protein [Pseudomonas aeruginosa]PBN19103.1 enoyl-CoA hydratase [Pseudomonas aeruginosa]